MKKFLPIAIMFLLLPLYADWNDHHLTLLSTGPSSIEGASKYELKDGDGRIFHVNSVGEPERPVMKRILKHKDDFFSWKNITIKELSFYMYEKGIQATIVPSSINYKNEDLKPYLPSGFTFIEEKDGLNYRYRIIVGNTSLKLDGGYKGEEPLLKEMHAYITGIKDGKIVVEDERVVSGSVVSFIGEKDKGEKQVHPIGDLTDLDRETGVAGTAEERGKLKIYASGQVSYLLPVNFLGDIFVGGYGFTLAAGLCDLGFSLGGTTLFTFDIEFYTGFWYLNERKQKDEYNDYSITNAYIIPIGLTARYRITIIDRLSVAPAVSFGYYFSKLEYERVEPARSANVSVREWNPSLTLGFRFEYRFEKIIAFAGMDFLTMFERRLNITTLLFNAGGAYLF